MDCNSVTATFPVSPVDAFVAKYVSTCQRFGRDLTRPSRPNVRKVHKALCESASGEVTLFGVIRHVRGCQSERFPFAVRGGSAGAYKLVPATRRRERSSNERLNRSWPLITLARALSAVN